jgi:hypothetical protein
MLYSYGTGDVRLLPVSIITIMTFWQQLFEKKQQQKTKNNRLDE